MTRVGDPSLLRRLNLAAALRAFLDAPALTQRELRDAIGVSRPTAETLLSELLDSGRIEEATSPGLPRAGRPARYFRFRAGSGHVSGLDIGAHKTMAVVCDLRGRTVAVRRSDLDPDQDAPSRLRAAVDTALACWADAGLAPSEVTAVACGVTGALRAEYGARDVSTGPTGAGLAPYSLPGFTEVDVAAVLTDGLGRPVTVANDVKLAALAEHWQGAARDHGDLVYMFAGHRAGAGVLFGGRVHEGRHGAAGEIGALPTLGWEAAVTRLHARGAALASTGRGHELATAASRPDQASDPDTSAAPAGDAEKPAGPENEPGATATAAGDSHTLAGRESEPLATAATADTAENLPRREGEPVPTTAGGAENLAGHEGNPLAGAATENLPGHEGNPLAGAATENLAGREGELVAAAAAAGDAESLAVLTDFATVLARGAAVLALAVDPEAVVLGGGMSRAGAVMVEPFRRELARLTLFPVEVITSTLGAESVALGAARLALDEVMATLLGVPNS